MTHTLAMEWASHGIRVNSISPGFVRTQMTAKIEAAPDFQTKMKVSSFGCCCSFYLSFPLLRPAATGYIIFQTSLIDRRLDGISICG